MPSVNAISIDKLARLIGTAKCPVLLDVRGTAPDMGARCLIPGSVRREAKLPENWCPDYAGRAAVVISSDGKAEAEAVAAFLRDAGAAAEILEGGFAAWTDGRLPLVAEDKLPPRDARGRTLWVTRARPKVDRIACPWLIRRFVDPYAAFLFVTPSEVAEVAARTGAAPFDMENGFWSHRGETCTFDTMLDEFGLKTEPLLRLATIVRAADTARLELAPEAAGLLAASLGLSRIYSDDLAQLEAGLALYDAFYRWCRDAVDETHEWPATAPKNASSKRRTPA